MLRWGFAAGDGFTVGAWLIMEGVGNQGAGVPWLVSYSGGLGVLYQVGRRSFFSFGSKAIGVGYIAGGEFLLLT